MQISGKIVHKTWSKNVHKYWNGSFPQFMEKSTEVLQNFIDKFYTKCGHISSLLIGGFTHFPHRTTITITIFNNKEINF